MSENWVVDIAELHDHYGFTSKFDELSPEMLKEYLQFRIKFLQEELDELKSATNQEDVVDALIDLCVVAIGTLDAFNVDSGEAWDLVHEANMNKTPGVKASRPNPFGLPDLIKPEGWVAPDHSDIVKRSNLKRFSV